MNNKRAIYEFFIFKCSDIGLLCSKITIFIIEITQKLLLLTKYGWNNPNWGRLGLKNPKLHVFAISGSSKFIAYTNIQIHVTHSIFIVIFFCCLNARNNVIYQNQQQLNSPKSSNYCHMVSSRRKKWEENARRAAQKLWRHKMAAAASCDVNHDKRFISSPDTVLS